MLSRFCHRFVTAIYLPIERKGLILRSNGNNTMKSIGYNLLLTICFIFFAACTAPSAKYTPIEEQRLAHDYLAKANNVSTDENEQRLMLFDKAIYHFANIVVMLMTPYVPMHCSLCDG